METDKIMAVVNQLQVQKENQNHQVVRFKPTVIGDEDEFTKALQHNQIVKSTIDDITNVLRVVMLKVGIREKNLPSSEETDVLIDHILINYGNHTPHEIKLAFDMGLAGKLEDANPKGEPIDLDINPYGEFNCIYFSKIMNAYRRWARQTFNQLKMQQQEVEEPHETIDVVDMIERWRVDPKLNMLLIPLFFYDFLITTEQIKITDEEKWEWFRKAKESIKAELLAAIPEDKTNNSLNEWNIFQTSEQTKKWDAVMFGRIGNRAKRMIVYEYLTKK